MLCSDQGYYLTGVLSEWSNGRCMEHRTAGMWWSQMKNPQHTGKQEGGISVELTQGGRSLANLSRSNLYKASLQVIKHSVWEGYGGLSLHTLSTFTLRPKEGFVIPLSLEWKGTCHCHKSKVLVFDIVVPMSNNAHSFTQSSTSSLHPYKFSIIKLPCHMVLVGCFVWEEFLQWLWRAVVCSVSWFMID